MLGPRRSPHRYPPPPSSSKSLVGMEKVVPPQRLLSSSSPFSRGADTNKPLPPPKRSPSRSPFSPAADNDKPLPELPRSTSSVYITDSGYTNFIGSRSNYIHDEEPSVPLIIQPVAYQDTISALLRRRLDESPSPKSVPSATSINTLPSQTSSHLFQVSPESQAISAISASYAADSRNALSPTNFSSNLQNQRTKAVNPAAPPSPSPQDAPNFRAISYESTRPSPRISPRNSAMIEQGLVPATSSTSNNRGTVVDRRTKMNHMTLKEAGEGSESRFSESSADDSYVIYTGIRDSIRAYVRHKMQKKHDRSKKERQRVMSIASAKYPGMLTAKEFDRRFSSGSRKADIQQGVSSVYSKLSKLSISGPSGQSREEKQQPRARKKQLAIPTSAYQKYGAAVWVAPRRWKKPQGNSKTPINRNVFGPAKKHNSISGNAAEVVDAFRSGRSQIIHALDDTKHKLTQPHSEKRREALKRSIRLVGPAGHVSDGRMNYQI